MKERTSNIQHPTSNVQGEKRLRVMVVCGMTEKKLRQKISPIQALPGVGEILLVRREPFEGAKISCFSPPRFLRGCVLTGELWRLLTVLWLGLTRRPDVAVGMTLIGHCVYVYLLRLLFGVPAVFHIMGKQDLQQHRANRPRLQRLLWRFSLEADVLVTRGERSRQLFIRDGRMSEDRVFVQRNVFDFKGYERGKGDISSDLVYVGYLSAYKSVDLLLDVVARLNDVDRNVRLCLVGDGPLRQKLATRAGELGLVDCVEFAGHLEESDLVKKLQTSRIFVMTSLGEGLPQAMIEAMACGLPCVLFDDSDVREIVRPGENGILVPPGDVEAFAGAVRELLVDEEYYGRIADRAEKIKEELGPLFSLETQTKVWGSVLARTMEP